MLEVYVEGKKKKKRYSGLRMDVETVRQFYRTKGLELKYYSQVSQNCTNVDSVILLNVCIFAHGSYLQVILKVENNTCR